MLKRLAAVVFAVMLIAMLWLSFYPAQGQPEAAKMCIRPQVIVKLPRICLPLL
jgi:hypothetical protein